MVNAYFCEIYSKVSGIRLPCALLKSAYVYACSGGVI